MYVFSEAIDSRAGFLGYVRVFRGQGKQGVCYAMYVFSEARERRQCARLCACFQRPEKAETEVWWCTRLGG